MESMKQITEILSTVSAWTVSATAIVTFLAMIFKPIRKLIGTLITKVIGKRDDSVISELKRVEKTFLDRCSTLEKKIDEVSEANKMNERDRLRSEIFRFGNAARRGEPIGVEEFRSLQRDFEKYTALGGNSIAHDEYEFVRDYFNDKRWEMKS